jgi:polar amino acid transport system substrate-binding protein
MVRFLKLKALLVAGVVVMAVGCGTSSTPSASSSGSASYSHGPIIDAIRAKGVLTIGVDDDPPWSFAAATATTGQGAVPDMLSEFAKREGIAKVDLVPLPFSSFVGALQSNRIDAVGDTMTPTSARSLVISFPNNMVYNPGGLIVKSGNPMNLHQHVNFNNNVKVAAQEGTLYVQQLKADQAKGQTIQIITFPGDNDVINAVTSGQADAGLLDATAAQFAKKQNSSLKYDVVTDFNDPRGRSVSDAGFAHTPNDLLDAWNKRFGEMSVDGTVDKILQKYGLTPSIYVANPADPAYTQNP